MYQKSAEVGAGTTRGFTSRNIINQTLTQWRKTELLFCALFQLSVCNIYVSKHDVKRFYCIAFPKPDQVLSSGFTFSFLSYVHVTTNKISCSCYYHLQHLPSHGDKLVLTSAWTEQRGPLKHQRKNAGWFALPPDVRWSNTEQQSCSSLRGASGTVGIATTLGSITRLDRLGKVTPRGMLGNLGRVGRLGMVMPLGRLGGLMHRGRELKADGMVTPRGMLGKLERVPGIFDPEWSWEQVEKKGSEVWNEKEGFKLKPSGSPHSSEH